MPGTFQLTSEQAAFLESGVSIIAASRDARGRPLLGRCAGCRVGPDGTVTLLLSRARYPLLIDAIRRSGAIAATFAEPSSHKSLQLKSAGAKFAALAPGDEDCAAAYLALFAADLDRIGQPADLARTVLAAAPGELVAIRFRPEALYTQTPGAKAGQAVGP